MFSPQPHVICPHALCPNGACAEHLTDKLLDPLGFCERAAEKQTGAQVSARGPGQRASSLCDAGPKPAMSLVPVCRGPPAERRAAPGLRSLNSHGWLREGKRTWRRRDGNRGAPRKSEKLGKST